MANAEQPPESKQAKAEAELHDQTNLLPRAQLLVVFATMASAFLVAYSDQNGIAVALPSMAKDLDAGNTISWAGTSSMIANTVFQVSLPNVPSSWLISDFSRHVVKLLY